jgi:hypothetical protein
MYLSYSRSRRRLACRRNAQLGGSLPFQPLLRAAVLVEECSHSPAGEAVRGRSAPQ